MQTTPRFGLISLSLSLSLLAAGCGERSTVLLDGSMPIDALVQIDDAGKADAAQPKADSAPLKLDTGGGSFVYHGRVHIGQGTDPRINMPGWVIAQVGFATVFYEAAFSATLTAGACRFGQMLAPPPGITNFVDAGKVAVSGALMPINFSYQPQAYYADDLKDGVFSVFTGGQTLAVKAAGGPKLPAFSGQVPTPAALKVKTPDMFQMSTTVDTSKGYAVTWTPSTADRVRVMISCNGPTGQHRVECDSTDDGTLALPSKILKAIAPTCSGSKVAQVDVVRLNERHVEQGALRVTLRASTTIRGGLVFK